MGEANHQAVTTKASGGEVHVEGTRALCSQPGTALEVNPPGPAKPSDDGGPG